MICAIGGKITHVEEKTTSKGKVYKVLKILQESKRGDCSTVALRVWGTNGKEYKVGEKVMLHDVSVSGYVSRRGGAGVSIDLWDQGEK